MLSKKLTGGAVATATKLEEAPPFFGNIFERKTSGADPGVSANGSPASAVHQRRAMSGGRCEKCVKCARSDKCGYGAEG